MSSPLTALLLLCLAFVLLVAGQQQCYYGPGAQYRGPSNLVACNNTGTSACCLLGDICLSGNACWDYITGDTYQYSYVEILGPRVFSNFSVSRYGCTDVNYKDPACPYKCGWNATLSPWIGLEYCDEQDVADQWVCHSPESCGCEWNSTYDLLVLEPRGCKAMGSNARVGLSAPTALAPYVSLPTKTGGSTGYFSPTVVSDTSTWVSTVIAGYTPSPFTQFTTYRAAPTSKVLINPGEKPQPSTNAAATSPGPTSPTPTQSSQNTETSQSMQTTSTGSEAAESTGNSTSPTSAPSSGLSTGAKAGIGVGVAVPVLLLLIVLILLGIARKRRRQNQSQQQIPPQYQDAPQYGPAPHMQMPPQHYTQGAPMHGWTPHPAGDFHYQDASMMYPAGKPPFSPASSPPMEPTELSADSVRDAHEMDSQVSATSPQVSAVSPAHTTPGSPGPQRLLS
ncbi:hypothetical protein NA57DRAFT_54868 [Rhizodiscina lignyota]|uniref:Uncharacterized protein n=1 Tax=Rhizodiscina lignyota TaxID=1504668 RepID=A0A9P4M7K3_9PEZI|nr:hypothetical protein NA57DRAFT_54868 [Rhizodiscina lignyota]